jgi:hypothetical protein
MVPSASDVSKLLYYHLRPKYSFHYSIEYKTNNYKFTSYSFPTILIPRTPITEGQIVDYLIQKYPELLI